MPQKKVMCLPCMLSAFLLIGVAAFGAFFILTNHASPKTNGTQMVSQENVVAYARNLFTEYQRSGQDLSGGPCLDNGVKYPDWVVDVAHNPRQARDDDPAYQCAAFLEGRAHHFVELDTQGKVLRIH